MANQIPAVTEIQRSNLGNLRTRLGSVSLQRSILSKVAYPVRERFSNPLEAWTHWQKEFQCQPPYEDHTVQSALNAVEGQDIVLFVYLCRAPKHQHETAWDGNGFTSRFTREIAAAIKSTPLVFDLWPCPATAEKPKCDDLPGDLKPKGIAHIKFALRCLRDIITGKKAFIRKAFIFGRVSNRYADEIKAILPQDCRIYRDLVHPAGLSFMKEASPRAGWTAMVLSDGLSGTGEQADVRRWWNGILRLSIFKRHRALTFDAYWKSFNGVDPTPSSKAFASESTDDEYQAWCQVERPASVISRYRAGQRLRSRLPNSLHHTFRVLLQTGTPADTIRRWWETLGHEDIYLLIRECYTNKPRQIVQAYTNAGTGTAELPPIPQGEDDLWAFNSNQRTFATLEGPQYNVRCDGCNAAAVRRDWVLGFPRSFHHNFYAGSKTPEHCGMWRPVDPLLAAVSVTKDVLLETVEALYNFRHAE